MNWDDIVGQENVKKELIDSIDQGRISHAQLFVGKLGHGSMPLALAYAKEIIFRENDKSAQKVDSLNHLDLHLSFPTVAVSTGRKDEKKKATSSSYYKEFKDFILSHPYADYSQWDEEISHSKNSKPFFSVEEVQEQLEKLSLKSFEGGSKFLVIWCADYVNKVVFNKLLKFLEEPPKNTIILLVADSVEGILPTVLSRLQVTRVPALSEESIALELEKSLSCEKELALKIAKESDGDYGMALKLFASGGIASEFETLFVQWVREAFQVKKNPSKLKDILLWARKISEWNKEKQLNFLEFCASSFRLALVQNYGANELVVKKIEVESFKWNNFSSFIHGANIEDILIEINNASRQINQNGNSRLVMSDLGIKLSRYIHRAKPKRVES